MMFDPLGSKPYIRIDFKPGLLVLSREPGKGIDGIFKEYDTPEKTWRGLNIVQHICLLHAFIPRVDIGEGKYRQVSPPWAGWHMASYCFSRPFYWSKSKAMGNNMLETIRTIIYRRTGKLYFSKFNPVCPTLTN